MKLLVVEDDPKAASFLKKGLGEEGFVVDVCHDGQDGLHSALSGQYTLMVLDVMLPIMDGWSVLKEMREQGCNIPVLMLTAQDSVAHRIRGLSHGADDYLVKPFAFGELAARIRAVLRRNGAAQTATLKIEDLTLDPKSSLVERAGVKLELTAKEAQLLELLLRHQGEVLSRTYIAEAVWEMTFDSDSNVIDVNIRRLRAKVDDPHERKLIHTVRGRGYVIR
ncbi:DNA-binding heavy metal response regulator [alpha proteobacterium U9-1i]|nr:DNA-binding heavy metal response regulator [alpha proteobacterium U9-1i]